MGHGVRAPRGRDHQSDFLVGPSPLRVQLAVVAERDLAGEKAALSPSPATRATCQHPVPLRSPYPEGRDSVWGTPCPQPLTSNHQVTPGWAGHSQRGLLGSTRRVGWGLLSWVWVPAGEMQWGRATTRPFIQPQAAGSESNQRPPISQIPGDLLCPAPSLLGLQQQDSTCTLFPVNNLTW